jgi:hypothetical protein
MGPVQVFITDLGKNLKEFCVNLCESWSSLRDIDVEVHLRTHAHDDRPFIVLAETKPSKRHIPVWARYSPLHTHTHTHARATRTRTRSAGQSRALEGWCPCGRRISDVEIRLEMCITPGNPEYTLH